MSMPGERAVTLLHVPYHLGLEGEGMALGPDAYLEAGLEERLHADGHQVLVRRVRRADTFTDQLSALIDVNAELAGAVREADALGRLPLVAGGNCNVVLGMCAGLGTAGLGIVWLDAHGDLNTPETTPSGFIDGMPLAMAVGLCHREAVWGRLGGDPVSQAHTLHVGGRDLDPGEIDIIRTSDVSAVTAEELRAGPFEEILQPALDDLRRRAERIYLHIDIDILDPSYAPAVDFPAPGGLSPDELLRAVEMIADRLHIRGVTLSAVNPQRPEAARTIALGMDIIERLIVEALRSRP